MVPADSIGSFSTHALDGQFYFPSSTVGLRKKHLHPRVVVVCCGNSCLVLPSPARTHARAITHFRFLTERAEAGINVSMVFQLNPGPDDFRFAWETLPVSVWCTLMAKREFTDYRSSMGDSLAGCLTAYSNAKLGS